MMRMWFRLEIDVVGLPPLPPLLPTSFEPPSLLRTTIGEPSDLQQGQLKSKIQDGGILSQPTLKQS